MGMAACYMEIHKEEADFIAYIYPERVQEILSALNRFDIEHALDGFSPRLFAEHDIYPSIWEEDETDSLREELSAAFQGLKSFYHTTAEKKKGIIVSIF